MPADANFHRTFSSTTDEDSSVVLPTASHSFLNNASSILDDPIFSRESSGLDLVDTIIENATSRAALRLLSLLSDLAIDPPRDSNTDTSATSQIATNHRDFTNDLNDLFNRPSDGHTGLYHPSLSNRYHSIQDSDENLSPDSNDHELISPDNIGDEQATTLEPFTTNLTGITDASRETFDLLSFMDQQLNENTSMTDIPVNDIVDPLSNITESHISNTVTSSSPTNYLNGLELPSLEEEQPSVELESRTMINQPTTMVETELTSSSDSSTSNSTAQSSPSVGRTSRLRRHRFTPSRIHSNSGTNLSDSQSGNYTNISPASWASTTRHIGWMSRPPAWVLLDQLQDELSNSTDLLQQDNDHHQSSYSTVPDLNARDRSRYRSRTLAATSWMTLANAANIRMRGKPTLTNSNKQFNAGKERHQVIVKVMGQHGVRVGEGQYI